MQNYIYLEITKRTILSQYNTILTNIIFFVLKTEIYSIINSKKNKIITKKRHLPDNIERYFFLSLTHSNNKSSFVQRS